MLLKTAKEESGGRKDIFNLLSKPKVICEDYVDASVTESKGILWI